MPFSPREWRFMVTGKLVRRKPRDHTFTQFHAVLNEQLHLCDQALTTLLLQNRASGMPGLQRQAFLVAYYSPVPDPHHQQVSYFLCGSAGSPGARWHLGCQYPPLCQNDLGSRKHVKLLIPWTRGAAVAAFLWLNNTMTSHKHIQFQKMPELWVSLQHLSAH